MVFSEYPTIVGAPNLWKGTLADVTEDLDCIMLDYLPRGWDTTKMGFAEMRIMQEESIHLDY